MLKSFYNFNKKVQTNNLQSYVHLNVNISNCTSKKVKKWKG